AGAVEHHRRAHSGDQQRHDQPQGVHAEGQLHTELWDPLHHFCRHRIRLCGGGRLVGTDDLWDMGQGPAEGRGQNTGKDVEGDSSSPPVEDGCHNAHCEENSEHSEHKRTLSLSSCGPWTAAHRGRAARHNPAPTRATHVTVPLMLTETGYDPPIEPTHGGTYYD